MDLNRPADDGKKGFRSAPSWAIVFPYSDNARDKKLETMRVRFEVLHRLKAANLDVACLINSTHTQVHVVLSAGLERIETEAEKAGVKKLVRCNGGLAKFSCKKRHLFGPLVLDETRFFTSCERQELIMRIVMSNPRFAGAGIDLDALFCNYSAKALKDLPPGKLSSLAMLLSGGESQGPLTHRSAEARDSLVETVMDYMKAGPFIEGVYPLHEWEAQEQLAQAFAGRWFHFPNDIECSNNRSLLEILHQSQSDPRGAAVLVSSLPMADALRNYFGDSHSMYFVWMGDLSGQLLPLVVLSIILFSMHNSTSPLNVENGVLGILAMAWINKYAAQWNRSCSHLQYRWGLSKEAREMAVISLRSACAQNREMERKEAITADNVRQKKATRRDRAIVQLFVLGSLGICSVFIYLLVRWSRSYIFGEPTTPLQVLVMSLIDVARIYLMQNIGRVVLLILAKWDDDITSKEDKTAWQISKYIMFDICNNFCSIAISVGYQAFSAGTDWKFVEAPSCFHRPYCQYDLELHIWTIFGVKYLLIPLIISLWNTWKFTVVRSRVRKERLNGRPEAGVGNTRKGAQAGMKNRAAPKPQQTTTVDPATGKTKIVRPPRRGIWALILGRRGPPLPITVEYDNDGLYGETPLETQMQLKEYDPFIWELRRPCDLVMVIAFVALCSSLAPLLPLAALVFISIKLRLDAFELIVTTQRPPCNRNRDIVIWNEAISWIGLLAVISTSIGIMFATPDVEELIRRLATSYRTYLDVNPQFKLGTNCVAGICLDTEAQGSGYRAEGALYWIIWTVIVAIGLGSRTLAQLVFRLPSLWMLRHEQVESDVQALLGLGPVHCSEDESALVLEEYTARYNGVVVDPDRFEKAPA